MTTPDRHPAPPAPPLPAVSLREVTRRFRARGAGRPAVLALDRVTLDVPPGSVFGVLGPNGAGKTTLLRIIGTLLAPTAGEVRVLGIDAVQHPEAVRRQLGVVLGGERSVYWRLTGRENLLYAAALYGLPPQDARERADALLALVGLAARADDLVESYSTGMRQRLALARALIHDPALLLLDEPTAGLDLQAATDLRRLLAGLRAARDRTVVVATHHVEEAGRLCDMLVILDRGRVLACDAPSALRALGGGPGGPLPSLETAVLDVLARAGHAGRDATARL
ncbi:MAG: ABC transporter ATP-binding protein [Armatimonadota bacterium]|nr:ABC transporter ATP-binding protein [Armatimonadota bacterium]MDR7535697.1 ABC transporter ATP-binding protein [Armatimonadota bacterium]